MYLFIPYFHGMRIIALLLTSCIACSGNTRIPDTLTSGKVIDKVLCQADTSQSYALYIPVRKGRMPVVYLFDSHGKGDFPVSKYKALADTFGFILVGSNNSRNGNDYLESDHIWQALTQDTKERLPIDSGRVYTCGFSGGAKVASYLAIMHPEVKGVIVNGAGLPDGTRPDNFDFSLTSITGEGDLNMTDLVAFDKALDGTRTRHCILFFDGKHEWAPEHTMGLAFAGWQLDAMRQGVIPRDEAFIQHFAASSPLPTLLKTRRLIAAERECLFMTHFLDGLGSYAGAFKRTGDSIAGVSDYLLQMATLSAQLESERATKLIFMDHLERVEKTYWNHVIDSLQRDGGPMSQRLQAFLSLEFYMYSSHLLGAGENAYARYFIDLYKLVDPTNTEAWYLSAVCAAREGQEAQVNNDLKRAVALGFTDAERFKKQPEFQGRVLP